MKTSKKFTSLSMAFLILSTLWINVWTANNAQAIDKDYKKEFLTDSFVKHIQMHLEDIRSIEESFDAPVTKSDLGDIEDLFQDQLDLLENELIRLSNEDFTQQERLEIESVLIEINQQFVRTLNSLDDKVENDAEDDFDELSADILAETLTYQQNLKSLLETKLISPVVTKTQVINEINQLTEDLDNVVDYLKNTANKFDNLTDDISSANTTSSELTSFASDSLELMEDADNELRKIDYISTGESHPTKQAIREINSALDKFTRALEEKFSSSFEDQTRDALEMLDYADKQLNRSLTDVLANDNDVYPAVDDVIEDINSLAVQAHEHQESIPTSEIGQIIENLEDLLDDEDEDADDLLSAVDELDDESTAYGSVVENDLKDDLRYQVDEMLDGFERIRKGTYRTSVNEVISGLSDLETELTTIKNNIDNMTDYEELEDVEESLQEILYRAKSYVLELRLRSFNDSEEADIISQVDSLAVAMSNTYEELDDRASSLTTYLDEVQFDLLGTGDADVATSEYSILQEVYDAIGETQAGTGDGQTTATDLLTYISTKKSSIPTIDNNWHGITAETTYRDGEQDLIELLNDIEFEMYRLMPGDAIPAYEFDKSINSEVIANNIGYYYQNIINEAEDKIDTINNFISTSENEDLEESVDDLYQVIDDSLSILQDVMVSGLSDAYTDIASDVEDEKDRLNRTLNSLSISNSSSSSNSTLVQSIKSEFSDRKGDIVSLASAMPAPISTYSGFDEVNDDMLNALIDIEKSVKLAHSRTLTPSDRRSIQTGFDEMINELEDYLIDLQENTGDRVRSDARSLKRTIKKSIIEYKIVMDDIDVEEDDDDDDYNQRTNLSTIERQVSDLNISPDTLDEMLDYFEELEDFRYEARTLEDALYELIENKPTLDEIQSTQMEDNYDNFQDYWKDTIGKFEDVIFDDDDTDYLIDSFDIYMDRYYVTLDALFQSALNGYTEVSIEFPEIYEQDTPETDVTDDEEQSIENETPELVDTKFADVKKDNAFSPYIKALNDNGAINGYEDGSFYPNKNVTRAEFIKIAIAAKGVSSSQLQTDNINFIDVNKENALSPYIGYAVKKKYINGYDSMHFGPNDPITRIDAVRILIRVLNLVSIEAPEKSEYFSDITSPDLATLTDRVYKEGILSGNKDGTFKPYNPISRGETAKILANAFVEI